MDSASPYRVRPGRPVVKRAVDASRGADACQIAAWRAPGARRFNHRPANDPTDGPAPANDGHQGARPHIALASIPTPDALAGAARPRSLSGWIVPVVGALIVVLLAVMAGGALRL